MMFASPFSPAFFDRGLFCKNESGTSDCCWRGQEAAKEPANNPPQHRPLVRVSCSELAQSWLLRRNIRDRLIRGTDLSPKASAGPSPQLADVRSAEFLIRPAL
jgi:hypothetical protein